MKTEITSTGLEDFRELRLMPDWYEELTPENCGEWEIGENGCIVLVQKNMDCNWELCGDFGVIYDCPSFNRLKEELLKKDYTVTHVPPQVVTLEMIVPGAVLEGADGFCHIVKHAGTDEMILAKTDGSSIFVNCRTADKFRVKELNENNYKPLSRLQ